MFFLRECDPPGSLSRGMPLGLQRRITELEKLRFFLCICNLIQLQLFLTQKFQPNGTTPTFFFFGIFEAEVVLLYKKKFFYGKVAAVCFFFLCVRFYLCVLRDII